LIKARDIRPGDTVVLPASRGGCNQYGWSPDNRNPVVDLGDWCALEKGTRWRTGSRMPQYIMTMAKRNFAS